LTATFTAASTAALTATLVHAAGAFAVAAAITALVWRLGPKFALLAHPNERSAHDTPIPTAGGIGFVVTTIAWLAILAGGYPPALALAIFGAAIAGVGLGDDIFELRRDVRMICYLAVGVACIVSVFEFSPIVTAAAIVGLTSWVNLYNFMDGTDGLAASQAIAYAVAALILGSTDQSTGFLWVLLAATAGFICFNWAPAKVFMGDVGSMFLGLTTGVLVLWLWQSGELPLLASLILLVAFWFDAGYTLCVRITTGQAFVHAHRTHLYQIICQRFGHGATAGLFWLYSLVWLWPLAALAVVYPAGQFLCLAAACLPIAIACIVLRAGIPRTAHGA